MHRFTGIPSMPAFITATASAVAARKPLLRLYQPKLGPKLEITWNLSRIAKIQGML